MHRKKKNRHMHKTLYDYDAVIFDMDGTLYYQPPIRFTMARKLIAHYLRHPLRVRELMALRTFRQIREHWQDTASAAQPSGQIGSASRDADKSLDQRQYEQVGQMLHMPPERVKSVVEHWMYQVPLALLPDCQDRILTGLIRKLRRRGIPVIVYSDYPAKDKLRAMGIRADHVFCALDKQIMCLKPDPRGISHILSVTGLRGDQVLMIGDRYEKDGLCAHSVHADWLILPACPGKRKKLLKELFHETRGTQKHNRSWT